MISLLVLVGPTASGKTELAVRLAQALNGEIVSADSMLIYRGMNIGTAKPGKKILNSVPHHLIDICDPSTTYNTLLFVEQANEKIQDIHKRGKQALLAGGTSLYIKGLLEGIFPGPSANWEMRRHLEARPREDLYRDLCKVDPQAAARISPNDLRRIVRALEVFYTTGIPISEYQKRHTKPLSRYHPCFVGLEWERAQLYERIERRVDVMLKKGLVEECKRLLLSPYPLSRTAAQAIGYRESYEALAHPEKFSQLPATITRNTRRYVKRQMTWLRRFPVNWLKVTPDTSQEELSSQALDCWEKNQRNR